MIFDGPEAFQATGLQPRIMIVGGGPAGITLALKLGRSGIPVAVFEAGGLEATEESQEFYQGDVIGDPYFDLSATRLRYLGGSSNHWAGWCRPLDEKDFEAKPYVADTGWPIRRADLEPWAAETRALLDLPDFVQDKPVTDDLDWIQLIKSRAVRFGERFRNELETSRNIFVVTNCYARSVFSNGKRVTGADIWSRGRSAGVFSADHMVICTGGLENSRLLLWSNEISAAPVVPIPTALGRYWMEHPHYQAGDAILASDADFQMDSENEAFFGPTLRAMHSRRILNFGIRMVELPYGGAKQLIADLACNAPRFTEWAVSRLGSRLRCAVQLHIAWEQAPSAQNYIALSQTARDEAGVPRIVLHWQKLEQDRRTLEQAMQLTAEAFIRSGKGRVRLYPWVGSGQYPDGHELAGHHHMGGTRMGEDPRTSVVNADCRVHGMENLYVAGSSVFPTSGYANPTTTIVMLCLRLADHLRRVVS